MPFINGRFYMNPAYGRAVEQARAAETASSQHAQQQQAPNSHWVTMDGHHVLIQKVQAGRLRQLSPRDKAYLDKYYDAVATLAKQYNVEPALVLGIGVESGFGSKGTYLKTGDAFGMTGGSTKHMTTAASPTENVQQFFGNYGNQIRGTGSDATAFINALQGRNASGEQVKGWKVYNTVNPNWSTFASRGITEMREAIPAYLSQRK